MLGYLENEVKNEGLRLVLTHIEVVDLREELDNLPHGLAYSKQTRRLRSQLENYVDIRNGEERARQAEKTRVLREKEINAMKERRRLSALKSAETRRRKNAWNKPKTPQTSKK